VGVRPNSVNQRLDPSLLAGGGAFVSLVGVVMVIGGAIVIIIALKELAAGP